jgi:glycosyltransferase involved in cell wall biosynthesis
MKIGIVVQRYGADINGGAELHARYIAEHLGKHVQVEVLTTCASDYITWRNALSAGTEVVHGVNVRRFPVARERDPEDFSRHSDRVFKAAHAFRDELAWLEAEGPTSPALVEHIRTHQADFDFFIFFSFRYYHAFHGIRTVPSKSILVPTAERDGALGLAMFAPVFRGVRGLMYNSFEERALIRGVAHNTEVPGVVVGVGSEIPQHSNAMRFRQKFDLREPFAIYIGRIDENKGCAELFQHFQKYTRTFAEGVHLVLIGNPIIPIPQHPRIHHLGFVDDQDKYDALAAASLLIMPSYFESLSMVALEAWAMGKPVLANGRCDVLKGQCIRSNGGLYYDNFAEFLETLRAIEFTPSLSAALGRNGRAYFNQHYSWPIIEKKYLDMFDRLKREPPGHTIEPLPGWFGRRRQTLPAAEDVVAQLPTGPAVMTESDRVQSSAAGIEGGGASLGESPRPPATPPQGAALTRPEVTAAAERETASRPANLERRDQRRLHRGPQRRRGPARRGSRRPGN